MKRACFVVLLACGGHDAPPRTEVSIAPVASDSAPEPIIQRAERPDASDDDLFDSMMHRDDKPATRTSDDDLMDIMLGADAGAPKKGTPTVRASTDTTSIGGLSRDVIRRVIRLHQAQLRACYEKSLQKQPDLAGRVSVRFTIEPSGSVSKVESATGTTLPNADTVRCTLDAFKTMTFPQPQGGSVIVTYPIVFASAN